MPTNNILLFDQNKANMLNDSAYNTNQQRLNGVQSGIASSQLQNKFQYQVSLVAYAIASIMYNNGMDANDADAVSAFVSNMSNTLVQKVLDKASTQEAQAGTVDTKWMSPSLVKAAIDFTSVKLSGSTMTGPLTLSGDPISNLQAATKQYVDSRGIKKLADTSLPTSGTTTILSQEEADKCVLYFGYVNSSSSNSSISAIDANNEVVELLVVGTNRTYNTAFMLINDVTNNISTSIYYRYNSNITSEATKYCSFYGTKFSGKIKTSSATSAKIVLYGFIS